MSAEEPTLIVIEARRPDTLRRSAQFIAHLICIQHKERELRYHTALLAVKYGRGIGPTDIGVRTGGGTWRIYFLQPYSESLKTIHLKAYTLSASIKISQNDL